MFCSHLILRWVLRPFMVMVLLMAGVSVMGVTSEKDKEEGNEEAQEVIVVVGTRNLEPRPVADSLVPIDVLKGEDFSMVGATADITDHLNTLVPSYVAAPATGDGSAFVRPTTLRGMAGDQTLVMVNGKRRHRSALVQLFAPAANNGSHGVDIAMIPSIALKEVQILRDGASAQYGSDAAAGVINFMLKDQRQGGSVEATYGNHFEGEASWRLGANAGFGWGEDGFVNLSVDTNDNEALSRGHQRPDAPDVEGVGSDSPFGDAPFVQTWGRPETSGTRFAFNSMYGLGRGMKGYFFGNLASTKGRFRFFYRGSGHGVWKNNALLASNLNQERGFTPYLDGEQTDMNLVAGLKGLMMDDINYDISVGTGSNKLDYTLYNTANPDAPLTDGVAQRDFDTGDYEQRELNVNLDFTRELSSSLHSAFGFEYRRETFHQMAGEENAYVGFGSSGLAGTRPEDAGEHSRSNYAFYGDLEHKVNESLGFQYALRFEDFEDFGNTINGKWAGRYDWTSAFAFRGAVSTGFHAPTPGQSNLRTTTTSFLDNGDQFDVGHFPAGHEAVRELGSKPLTEEKFVNMSLGLVYELSEDFVLTADYYNIGVEGRIYRADLDADGNGADDTSFYTNVMDLRHSGLDFVVMGHLIDWNMDVSLGYNMNQVDVTKNRKVNGRQVVSDALVEDIENNYPTDNLTLTTNTHFNDDWSLMVRGRYIGAHYDERGTIDGEDGSRSREVDPTVYLDLEVGYQAMKDLKLIFGGANILDAYPNRIEGGGVYANRWNVGLPYPRRSAANYEGGAWYVKAAYTF